MKTIWIDGYEANVPERVGSGQVSFELLVNIEKQDKVNKYVVLLPSLPLEDLPKERDGWNYKILRPNKLWTRIAIPWAYFRAKVKPDLIFTPTHYIPQFIKAKRVAIIFDLSYLKYPQMFKKEDLYKLKNWTKYSVVSSTHLITISNSTKKDIIKNYKVPSSKITVSYPGYDETKYHPVKDAYKIAEIQEKYKISGSYIIYIGTIQPRKNLIRLINAFKKIDNLKLVIVGKIKGQGRKAWMNQDILERPSKLKIEDKVIFTDFVPAEELPFLLSGSTAFILPSLYEGFGIPVVEAMACGVPVIVSNVSSLPEVVGKAGLLIDPLSEDQIAGAIGLITGDKKLHARLSKLALEQAQKFSWKKMAKEVIKVLETV